MRPLANRILNVWPDFARVSIGLFFLVSAYLKLTEGFFFLRASPLVDDWQYWLARNWTLPWYRPVLEFFMPYADIVAVFVILSHASAAVLLVLNLRTRLAGWILFVLQLNIFLATCLGWGFLVMVGSSLWIALFYIVQPSLTQRSWRWMTILFLLIYFLMILGRFNHGDPWLSQFPSDFAHYQEEVMGSHPLLKQWVIEWSAGTFGPWLWASMWWIHAFLFLLLFTRYRLIAGVFVGVLFTGRAMLWMNVLGAEAVIYMLLLFLWLATEALMQATYGVISLLPREEIAWCKRGLLWLVEPPKHSTIRQSAQKKRR